MWPKYIIAIFGHLFIDVGQLFIDLGQLLAENLLVALLLANGFHVKYPI